MIKKLLNCFRPAPQPELKFVCLLPEVATTMPITEASKTNYSWFRTATESFKQQKEHSIGRTATHVARCPGIISVSKTGWIQRSYQDIAIGTNGTGVGFDWSTPLDQANMATGHEWNYNYVSHHDDTVLAAYNNLKPHTLKTTVKIQSPWVVYVPSGYQLLCMPIPYPDDNRFTAAIGILDGDQGPNFLNVQIFWHSLHGTEIIPAGTPLAQYFLIKKQEVKTVIEAVNQQVLEDLRLRRMTLESQFLPSYAKLKTTFSKEDSE
jgi:hypothetical protein